LVFISSLDETQSLKFHGSDNDMPAACLSALRASADFGTLLVSNLWEASQSITQVNYSHSTEQTGVT